ncbi:hypothetical protein TNCV_3842951 [Trichonephila clavipes]|nr:hypothetical protein TNCV_3842951 [Trichonephila clavipes]
MNYHGDVKSYQKHCFQLQHCFTWESCDPDLELEVNDNGIEELIMEHADELMTEEPQEILNEEHQETQ